MRIGNVKAMKLNSICVRISDEECRKMEEEADEEAEKSGSDKRRRRMG